MQRYFSANLNNNKLLLSDNDVYHIYTVMRMHDKDLIEVVYDSKLYICILDINDKNNVLIKEEIESPESIKEITLIIPVLKEAKMDLILQKATELGVNKIIPITTSRTIVKVDLKEDKKLIRWQKIVKEASEQSKRLNIPVITNVMKINELTDIDGLKLVCSTKKGINTFNNALHNKDLYDKISIVVGPEGGLSDKEEEQLVKLGFNLVSLGNLIMRVETVPIYLMSVINFLSLE